MLKAQIWKTCVVLCAGLGVVCPQMALAAPPSGDTSIGAIGANPSITVDVSAREDHLQGQVVSPQGQPRGAVQIVAMRGAEVVASTVTDESGRFELGPISGGEYTIATSEGAIAVRIWAEGTAPPSAQNGLLVVAGDGVMRAQFGVLPFGLSNPWVLASLTAGAIILPIVLDDDASGN